MQDDGNNPQDWLTEAQRAATQMQGRGTELTQLTSLPVGCTQFQKQPRPESARWELLVNYASAMKLETMPQSNGSVQGDTVAGLNGHQQAEAMRCSGCGAGNTCHLGRPIQLTPAGWGEVPPAAVELKTHVTG